MKFIQFQFLFLAGQKVCIDGIVMCLKLLLGHIEIVQIIPSFLFTFQYYTVFSVKMQDIYYDDAAIFSLYPNYRNHTKYSLHFGW